MTTHVQVRQAIGPQDAARRDTGGLREGFLIDGLFVSGEARLTYSHLDRLVVGGIAPGSEPLALGAVAEVGTPGFLDRREAVIVNIGGPGTVATGDTTHALGHREALYVGMGGGALSFASADADEPALFYLVSAPAHRSCPTILITNDMARRVVTGSAADANSRTIRQYVHPEVCESCQLLLGITEFEPGSVWNTMPAHLHDRRMEAYLYFAMGPETRVFHLMGEPSETRHLVVANQEAVLSPPWSIHSGAGTGRYSFIWAMAGDNQDFTDMDMVAMSALR